MQIDPEQFYRTDDPLMNELIGSRSAIYLDLAAGRLPAPIKLGGRLYWPEDDLDAHLLKLREQAA